MDLVIYRKKGVVPSNSWIRYLLSRIKKNKNNLITVVGPTGSGKTYSAISICETMSKSAGVPFGIDNIVFDLLELMKLINSNKVKKGSCIIFDEPQVTISNKNFMSKANKVFNYLVSTFRHRNLSLFFCTPYEDLLDKSTRKMFHAKFETVSIDHRNKLTLLKPKIMQYNSQKQKFYEKYLRINYPKATEEGNITRHIRTWSVSIPSAKLIKQYEAKKLAFTTALNKGIEADLRSYEIKQRTKKEIHLLTPKEKIALSYYDKGYTANDVAKLMGYTNPQGYNRLVRTAKLKLRIP